MRIPRWLLNSTVVTVIATLGRVFLASLAGYALAKMSYPGKQILFALIIVLLAVPGVVLLIPKFLILKQLGMLNSYAGLIVPLMFDAFAIFLMKQFFEQLPDELIEAAAIDGASAWQTFSRVMLPLAAPGRDRPHHPLGAGDLERVPPPADRSARRSRAGHPAPGSGQSAGVVR